MDVRDVVGRPIDPREGPGRPPLDGRDHFGRPPVDIRENIVRPGIDHLGRRDHFGFNPEKPWGHRGDFDEREHRVLPVFGGPKGLHEERGRFRAGSYRFDPRSGPWNRGFGQEVHRDFDDRRRPWERQRDRDDRDFDFCREMNGNRLGRDRIQNTWVPLLMLGFLIILKGPLLNEKVIMCLRLMVKIQRDMLNHRLYQCRVILNFLKNWHLQVR